MGQLAYIGCIMIKSASQNNLIPPQYPTLFRRLAAWFYDILVVTAVLMLAGGIAMAIISLLLHFNILNLDPFEDVSTYLTQHIIASSIYTLYLCCVIVGFYTYFWTHGGQTLGMRAWKLKLQNKDGTPIKLSQAFIRVTTAILGFGNLLAFNTKRRAFQDIMSQCEMIVTTDIR